MLSVLICIYAILSWHVIRHVDIYYISYTNIKYVSVFFDGLKIICLC